MIADAGRGAGFLGSGDEFYLVHGLDFQVFSTLSGERLESYTTTLNYPEWGRALGASKDGRFLIASGHQPLDRKAPNPQFLRYSDLFDDYSWQPGSSRIAISDFENNTLIFDRPNGSVVQKLWPIRLPAAAIAYSPGGQYIATGHTSGVVRVWRTDPKPDGKTTLPIASNLFAISQDRQKIVPAGSGSYAAQPLAATRMFDLATSQPLGEEMQTGGAIMNAALSGSGQWCALAVGTEPAVNGRQTVSGPGEVQFFNPVTGEPLCAPFPCRSQPRGLAVHPSGDFLAVFCADGSTYEITVKQVGQKLQIEPKVLLEGGRINTGTDSVSNGRCRYSEDGHYLIVFSRQHFHIWDRARGEELATGKREAAVHEVDCKGDKLAVAFASGDCGIGIYDLSQKEWVGEPIHFTHSALLARFDVTGDHVLTNSHKGAAQVFDWRSGKPVGPGFDHTGVLLVADFIDDTPWVASGGYTQADLRLWDANTGFEARKDINLGSVVLGLEYIPELRRLVVAGNEIHIFDLDQILPAPRLDPVAAQQLAEIDAGGRVLRGGGLDVINNDEWLLLWRAFRAAHPDFPGHLLEEAPLPAPPPFDFVKPNFHEQSKTAK